MLNGFKIFAYLFYKNAMLDIKMLIDFLMLILTFATVREPMDP